MRRQARLGIGEPSLRRMAERGHADLGGQGGEVALQASALQGVRQGAGHARRLRQHAFLQRRGPGDDRLTGFAEPPVAVQHGLHRGEGGEQDVHGRQVAGRGGDGVGQGVAERFLAVEQRFTLVREVPEEGPLRHAGPGGDRGGGGRFVAALLKQLQGGLLQATSRLVSASGHAGVYPACRRLSSTLYDSH